MATNLRVSNYQGVCTGNPWNQGKAGPWPTMWRLLVHLTYAAGYEKEVAEKALFGATLAAARRVPTTKKFRRGCRWPIGFPSLQQDIACRPCGKGLRLGVHSKQITTLSPLTLYFMKFLLSMWHCIGRFSRKGIVAAFYRLLLLVVMEFSTLFFHNIHYIMIFWEVKLLLILPLYLRFTPLL